MKIQNFQLSSICMSIGDIKDVKTKNEAGKVLAKYCEDQINELLSEVIDNDSTFDEARGRLTAMFDINLEDLKSGKADILDKACVTFAHSIANRCLDQVSPVIIEFQYNMLAHNTFAVVGWALAEKE